LRTLLGAPLKISVMTLQGLLRRRPNDLQKKSPLGKTAVRQKRNGTDLVTGFEQFQFCGLCPRISQCLVDQVQRR
jgi:hypothetical protein